MSIIWILKRSKASLKAEGNSIIFLIRIISISYLKAHFKTTTTMVFTIFKKDFIFDEWIIDEYVASKKRDRLSKLKVIYWRCLTKVVIFQSATLPKICN